MSDLEIPSIHEVFFQFNDEDPVKFAYVAGDGDDLQFSLVIKPSENEESSVIFTDGKGNEFKLFMRKENEL